MVGLLQLEGRKARVLLRFSSEVVRCVPDLHGGMDSESGIDTPNVEGRED